MSFSVKRLFSMALARFGWLLMVAYHALQIRGEADGLSIMFPIGTAACFIGIWLADSLLRSRP